MSSTPRIVRVNLPGQAYDIVVQPGLLEDVGTLVRGLSSAKRCGLVTDTAVGPLYATTVEASLRTAGFQPIRAMIPAGENHKNIQSISAIYDQILPAGIDRATPLVALGGGVVGDMTGFAAATTLRGVPFVQIPTTLLSMVDASVGGKTGIDHALGKNLIGAFHQPVGVLIDPAVLKTLPPRELCSGLAECIKHDIIRDAEGFDRLERDIHKAISLDIDYLADLVAHNVAIKARVVEKDPFEKGERAHLNFGHTFGHAIESVSSYAMAHGECVAMGMIAAARTAMALGIFDEASTDRIIKVIASAGLPTGGLTLPIAPILNTMLYDKKVKAGKIRFVLPTRLGQVTIRDDVPADIISRAVESLR